MRDLLRYSDCLRSLMIREVLYRVRPVILACVLVIGSPFAAASAFGAEGESMVPSVSPLVHVLTQRNDNARTGANLNESILNTHNVTADQFGLIFQRQVVGQIYAQPLYVSRLEINGMTRNVVFVATMRNHVYAFDADNVNADRPLWDTELGKPVPSDFVNMDFALGKLGRNITSYIGITSTPVIDLISQTIYVVAKTCEGSAVACKWPDNEIAYWLHGLDLTTGRERVNSPVRILATAAGLPRDPDCRSSRYPRNYGVIALDAVRHLQRPALLLANGRIYLGFGSHQDTDPYHGWILAYDSLTFQQVNTLSITPYGCRGAVWQAGAGPASDASGNVYVVTGNGTFTSDGRNLGSSVVKLSPDLKPLDWFTPGTVKCLNAKDLDLGSAGVLLIPGTRFVVTGGKEGVLYLIDSENMGRLAGVSRSKKADPPCSHYERPNEHPPVQSFLVTRRCTERLPDFLAPFECHHIHGSPLFWDSPSDGPLVYLWPEADKLRAYQFDVGRGIFGSTDPRYMSTVSAPEHCGVFVVARNRGPLHCMPGGILSLSANGNQKGTGIIWATLPVSGNAFIKDVAGRLFAFNAENLQLLWDSEVNAARDGVGLFAKYNPPTIANGKVYIGTFSGCLNVYGLLAEAVPGKVAPEGVLPGRPCPDPTHRDDKVAPSSN